jgi:hypothetical protein
LALDGIKWFDKYTSVLKTLNIRSRRNIINFDEVWLSNWMYEGTRNFDPPWISHGHLGFGRYSERNSRRAFGVKHPKRELLHHATKQGFAFDTIAFRTLS